MFYNGSVFTGETDDLGHLDAPELFDASGKRHPILAIRGEMKRDGEFMDADAPQQPWVIEQAKGGLKVTHCTYRPSVDYGVKAARIGLLFLRGWKFAK